MTIEQAITKTFTELVEEKNRTFDAFPPNSQTRLPSDFVLSPQPVTECQILLHDKEGTLAVEMRRDTVYHAWELVFTVVG